MTKPGFVLWATLLALQLVLGLAAAAHAQTVAGNIYGHAADESGAVLPGATIKLAGANIGGLSTVSSARGEFHFLLLDPGDYTVSVSQLGLTTVIRAVVVTSGASLDLTFVLRVASTAETLTVTAETPVVDVKKLGTGATMTQDELANVPTARDPWALLRTVPGVMVDRLNIAGSFNDLQAYFVGKGADFADNSFILDGVSITADGGGSTGYFDFDSFQEIHVSTGGSDIAQQTGGVNISFTTKRGTNAWHGSARGYFTHDDFQWSNLPQGLVGDPRLLRSDGTESDKADHIRQIGDYGLEVGGPIVKDKLWIWGAYGRQDIRVVRLFRATQEPVKTYLDDWNAKLNWQASANDMVSFSYLLAEKNKYGSKTGYASVEKDSFLWNQAPAYPKGPHGFYKLEESHVFNANLFLNAAYSYDGNGGSFTPRGGTAGEGGVDRQLDIAYGSSPLFRTTGSFQVASVDLKHFREGWGGNHELRFGLGYRRTPIRSTSAYSGSKVFAYKDTPEGGVALVTRDGVLAYIAQFWDGYLGDTYTRDRLMVRVGLRFDHQVASNLPTFANANPVFPELLPALSYDGSGQGIAWNDLSPRVGGTYRLDEKGRTVTRVSYARYAGHITAYDAAFDNPNGFYNYLAYNWVDRNHDGFAQKDEVLLSEGVLYASGVDPNNPTSPTTPNRLDPRYRARHDDELIVGIDRELAPSLALSLAYTFRRGSNRAWTPRIGLTQADYTPNPIVTANGYAAQTFSPDPDKVDASNNGYLRTNRPDYRQAFSGFEVSLVKRLTNHWMARANVAYNDWYENFLGPAAIQNPTRTLRDPLIDGGQVVNLAGVRGDVGISARWQVNANALCELPWGFQAAAALFGIQGYLKPPVLELPAGEDRTLDTLGSSSVEDNRLPAIWNLDLRVSKTIALHGSRSLLLSADLFNVFNRATVIDRNAIATSDVFGRIDGIQNPRIFRFGLRLTF
jgi:hypothetical protein